jgi:hypothetical protein
VILQLQGFLGLVGLVLAVVLPVGGAIGVYVHLAVRAELATFLLQLNGTYLRTVVYVSKEVDTDRRITALEAALGGGAGV